VELHTCGDSIITNSSDSDSEKSLKIGQYFMKLQGVQKSVPNFLATLYAVSHHMRRPE